MNKKKYLFVLDFNTCLSIACDGMRAVYDLNVCAVTSSGRHIVVKFGFRYKHLNSANENDSHTLHTQLLFLIRLFLF